jgi:Tol biopolymer transport system component
MMAQPIVVSRSREGLGMPTRAEHWSKEPGRWEATLAPEAWATIPRIQAPVLSPDGSKVAYIRGYDGRNDVWLLDLVNNQSWQLTDRVTPQGPDPSQRQAYPLAWGPESQSIVFAAGDGKLWMVPAEGGYSLPVEDAAGNHHSPELSLDGGHVAFVAERGETVDIFVAGIDGRLVRQITSPDDDEYVANPDRKSVV